MSILWMHKNTAANKYIWIKFLLPEKSYGLFQHLAKDRLCVDYFLVFTYTCKDF